MTHGEMLITENEINGPTNLPLAKKSSFGYMFPELQRDESENLLDGLPETVEQLRRLGAVMVDPGEEHIPGIPVPAIHTFFGQFVDHDITLELGTVGHHLNDPHPLSLQQIADEIVNSRTPNLELDNVYGPDIDGNFPPQDPDNPAKLLLGKVADGQGLPKNKDVRNDFHRLENGSPAIGDSRDDENVIINQLHVAFLRAHNTLVDRGCRFDEAQKLLIQHYQWLVLDDFLGHITDPVVVKMIRSKGARFFDPPARSFFVPLEFSVAAFRFGHSKVRAAYDNFNNIQVGGGLDLLFRPGRTLPEHWIISWPSFLDAEDPGRFPRPTDTSLTRQLTELPPDVLSGQDPEPNLATRNLLRGLILRMPTGQAVARRMEAQGIRPMNEEEIASVAEKIPGQKAFLNESKFLLKKTPLWFYILAEAAFYSRGHHLGPVGSTIVAEVLIAILRHSTYSILCEPHWRPTIGDTPGKFDLEDLLKLAGVFS